VTADKTARTANDCLFAFKLHVKWVLVLARFTCTYSSEQIVQLSLIDHYIYAIDDSGRIDVVIGGTNLQQKLQLDERIEFDAEDYCRNATHPTYAKK
jgi:hypothetical protein